MRFGEAIAVTLFSLRRSGELNGLFEDSDF